MSTIDTREPYEHGGLQFYVRPGTTDAKSIQEVVGVKEYFGRSFALRGGDRWLDLGANVGAFTVLALTRGCRVVAYEPDEDNFEMLLANAALHTPPGRPEFRGVCAAVVAHPTGGAIELALPRTEYNHWEATTVTSEHPLWPTRHVRAVRFADAVAEHRPRGIKLDIEGAELAILDAIAATPEILEGVDYLVGEYHFNYDDELANYHRRLGAVAEMFDDHWYRVWAPQHTHMRYHPTGRMFRFWNHVGSTP